MLKRLLLGIGTALAVLAIIIATRPAHFEVDRAQAMAVPPTVPYALVADLHQWGQWSPWEKVDPAMTREYAGPASGVGAQYHWSGNDKAGEGRMTITEAQPNQRIVIRLDFLRPMTDTNTVTFTFTPQGGSTQVDWRMAGEKGFMAKAFGMAVDMDAMIGGDFEKGLTAMKAAAEHRS